MTYKNTLHDDVHERVVGAQPPSAVVQSAQPDPHPQPEAPRFSHDQTFALRRALAGRGYAMPATGAAPSESWLLGLGGGVGVQVFTFQYKGVPPILYIGTRCAHQYAYNAEFMVRALASLGLSSEVDETGSARKAEAALLRYLADGPVVVWVGLEALRGVEAPAGSTPWVVVVHGVQETDDGPVYAVEDAVLGPLDVSAAHLASARKAVKKARHRLLVPVGDAVRVSAESIRLAVTYCVGELDGLNGVRGYRSNFGLPSLERWLKQAESSAKTGWRKVFSPGGPQLVARVQAAGWIDRATGGGAFRSLYAQFLSEAAVLLEDDALAAAAQAVAHCGTQWSALADWMLDPTDPVLAAARSRLDTLGWPLAPSALNAFAAMADDLPSGWGEDFYPTLATRLNALLAAERAARDALAAVG